ncbi:hypothetical protein LQW54_004803 [Pestalotiopsis sp. IQ-011]
MAVQDLIDHDPDDVSGPDGRKAKRELSQSKRAAQNRAAQRAFRQRKEHYIKKLEQQVRDYSDMEHSYKSIQNDNYALREYVIQLQSRLLDVQGEVPQPPPNLSLPPPPPRSASHIASNNVPESAPPAPPAPGAAVGAPSAGSLADVAAAVAGLRAHGGAVDSYSKFKAENDSPRRDEDARRLHDPLPPPPSSLRA